MTEIILRTAGTIGKIALEIKGLVNTVDQNKEECSKIANCVDINSAILKELVEKTGIAKVEVMDRALEDVKASFQDALDLVKKCKTRNFFRRYFSAKDMADELNRVQRDIGLKMQQASLCGIVHGATLAKNTHYAVTNAPTPSPPPPREEDIQVDCKGFKRFSLALLRKATNDFSLDNKIGEGAFSKVYQVVLDGLEVAIKRFDSVQMQNNNKLFRDEFVIGTKFSHKNVVRLLGYCIDIRMSLVEFADINDVHLVEVLEYILILAYLPNGSLEDITKGEQDIDWSSCFKIFLETAQGVHYIHEQRVIHLDLKPSNILFDSDMTPVICDFGSSKVLGPNNDEIDTDEIMGTVGYMAPEKYSNRVSLKSDVFGFGITLLETIIGKGAIRKHKTTASNLGPWYDREQLERMLKEAGGLKGLVQPKVKVDESQLTEVNRCVEVGLLCTESDPADRPTMADVVDILSGKKMLPTPKKRLEKVVTMKLGRPTKEEGPDHAGSEALQSNSNES